MVDIPPEQYSGITLSGEEATKAVESYKKAHRTKVLTTDETLEALRQGRERKHYAIITNEYWKKVNSKHYDTRNISPDSKRKNIQAKA